MNRLINSTTMTVDGVTDVGEWYVAKGKHDDAARDQFDGAAGMVLGRKSYEGLKEFWPQQTGAWADLLNPLPKFVASRTLSGPLEWNATPIEGDPAEAVARLKNELEGDLILIGCGDLARHLVAKGMVDELRFWIHPAVWGEGTRPYGGERVRMRLLNSTSY
nr:dihydrofolate reductase family protein [Actinomycetota bacterium]